MPHSRWPQRRGGGARSRSAVSVRKKEGLGRLLRASAENPTHIIRLAWPNRIAASVGEHEKKIEGLLETRYDEAGQACECEEVLSVRHLLRIVALTHDVRRDLRCSIWTPNFRQFVVRLQIVLLIVDPVAVEEAQREGLARHANGLVSAKLDDPLFARSRPGAVGARDLGHVFEATAQRRSGDVLHIAAIRKVIVQRNVVERVPSEAVAV
mmetsp:Transcript_17139/g.53542  ORF Transcript_17139/g.53542 Transcript_17139/m.53542 type:complete len:210 (-) Transcript_17139:1099-1728(-)